MGGDSEGKREGANLVGKAAVEAVHKGQCSGGGRGERNIGMRAWGGFGWKRTKSRGAVFLNVRAPVVSEFTSHHERGHSFPIFENVHLTLSSATEEPSPREAGRLWRFV